MDEVHSGTSVMSQSDLRLHFGLGQASVIDLIEVKWPTTGKWEKFTHVEPNQFLTIKEGAGIVKSEKGRTQVAASPARSSDHLVSASHQQQSKLVK